MYVSCPVASMYDFGPSLQQLQPFVDDNMTAMWISVKATTAVLCGNCKLLLRTSTNGAHTKRVIGCNQTCIHLKLLADLQSLMNVQTFKPLDAVRPQLSLWPKVGRHPLAGGDLPECRGGAFQVGKECNRRREDYYEVALWRSFMQALAKLEDT